MKTGIKRVSKHQSKLGMVSTASNEATQAGVKMLEAGGNAVDAAVAAAFCLGVTEPQASGIGGQSMALVYLDEAERIFALDGSSRAPFYLQPEHNNRKALKFGPEASTVPSTPAALGYLHETYGKLTLEEVLFPAVEACRKGFRLSGLQSRLLKDNKKHLIKDALAVKNFFRGKEPAEAGHVILQPELGFCLETLCRNGWQDFYIGEVGSLIVKDMEKRGGLITSVDMNQIPMPIEREPLESSYRNHKLYTFPPPGAGRVLVQMLNILENFPPEMLDPEKPEGALVFALAFRFALTDREKMPVHPDFYSVAANRMMTEKEYGIELAERIERIGAYLLGRSFIPPETSGETTHLSVMDSVGNAVGITQSIELVFGSKALASELGFFYNNYMNAFEYRDITHPYYLLPGAKPWSSVAPTLLFRDGRPFLLVGSPGSERISTSLAQVISRVIDRKMELSDAVAAPRFHVSGKNSLLIEKLRFSGEVLELLERMRFDIKKRGAYSFYLGCVQAVEAQNGVRALYSGVADPRRDGRAKGPGELTGGGIL